MADILLEPAVTPEEVTSKGSWIGDIGGDCDGTSARLSDFPDRLCQLISRPGDDRHGGTRRREPHRDRLADAPPAAGDDGNLTCQVDSFASVVALRCLIGLQSMSEAEIMDGQTGFNFAKMEGALKPLKIR